MEIKDIIASNIKELRIRKGLTQSDLACELSYTTQAISRWEKGKSLPDAVMLAKIASFFDVDIMYLYQEHSLNEDLIEDNKKVEKREKIFKFIFIASIFLSLLTCFSLVMMFIKIPNFVYFLWFLTVLSIILLILSIIFKMKRYRNFFIIWTIISFTDCFYFSFSKYIPNLVHIFFLMGYIILITVIYLVILSKKEKK